MARPPRRDPDGRWLVIIDHCLRKRPLSLEGQAEQGLTEALERHGPLCLRRRLLQVIGPPELGSARR
jgi:hypothetical protein